MVNTETLQSAVPRIDEEGWFWYTCTSCHKSKLAALFVPSELMKPSPQCRVCIGQINTGRYAKSTKKGKARFFGADWEALA